MSVGEQTAGGEVDGDPARPHPRRGKARGQRGDRVEVPATTVLPGR
ncbi:hypothetical protein [Streptomyces leeuwenhoekii]|nr:hypothetical protein [Streptomyces leeuwenhoekii]